MMYRYETHVHTSETSKCARSSGGDLALHFKSLGYTGLFVTDHFFNGNTTVSEDLPWPESVASFCRGYDAAAQTGREVGLDVFLGWEFSYGWTHFLTYGLDKDWLLANPDILSWDLPRYCNRVHEDGGGVVHAHPFREGVEIIQLVPGLVDAVEVQNSARAGDDNRHALDYAASFGLPRAAGSDIHSIDQRQLCGMGFSRRLSGGAEYISAIKSGEGTIIETSSDTSFSKPSAAATRRGA